MKILAIERELEVVSPERFTPELGKMEARRVWELQQAGTLREIYFRTDEPSAVLILECADVDEARRTLESLPLVAAGLIRFDVLPLAAYPGFARLFDPSVWS